MQEYLAARHIAAQPDPASINLVMEHLHDAWWQEVYLLTIGRLGSDQDGAAQAATLLRTILHRYRPPSRLLRSSRYAFLRAIRPDNAPDVLFQWCLMDRSSFRSVFPGLSSRWPFTASSLSSQAHHTIGQATY